MPFPIRPNNGTVYDIGDIKYTYNDTGVVWKKQTQSSTDKYFQTLLPDIDIEYFEEIASLLKGSSFSIVNVNNIKLSKKDSEYSGGYNLVRLFDSSKNIAEDSIIEVKKVGLRIPSENEFSGVTILPTVQTSPVNNTGIFKIKL